MSATSRRLVGALRLLALALIGLHLLAPSLPAAASWGLLPAAYLPAGTRWILAVLAAALALGGERAWQSVRGALAPALNRLAQARWFLPGAAMLAAVPFALFRINHIKWGDAKLLLEAIPHPDVRLTFVWQAPFDLFLHARAWQLGNRLFGWPDPWPVYRIFSTLAGIAFVWIALRLAVWLGRNRVERLLAAGLVLSLGTMEFFFGYMENYPIMTVGVLLYAWLALRAVRGELPLSAPAWALALTHAFHPSTIILAPSLLYVAWIRLRHERPAARWRLLAQVAVPYAIVFAAVVALMSAGDHGITALLGADRPGGGDARWFVPLAQVTTKWEHYTMFSVAHLADIANQQLLSAPVIWPAFLLAVALAWPRLPRHDPAYRLLTVMAVSYLLLTLTWNPDYGGQRDWDLFSPAAVPAAVLAIYALARALPERPALRSAGWALLAAQGYHLVAWIYMNTLRLPR